MTTKRVNNANRKLTVSVLAVCLLLIGVRPVAVLAEPPDDCESIERQIKDIGQRIDKADKEILDTEARIRELSAARDALDKELTDATTAFNNADTQLKNAEARFDSEMAKFKRNPRADSGPVERANVLVKKAEADWLAAKSKVGKLQVERNYADAKLKQAEGVFAELNGNRAALHRELQSLENELKQCKPPAANDKNSNVPAYDGPGLPPSTAPKVDSLPSPDDKPKKSSWKNVLLKSAIIGAVGTGIVIASTRHGSRSSSQQRDTSRQSNENRPGDQGSGNRQCPTPPRR
jgi:cell division protein FtsB